MRFEAASLNEPFGSMKQGMKACGVTQEIRDLVADYAARSIDSQCNEMKDGTRRRVPLTSNQPGGFEVDGGTC